MYHYQKNIGDYRSATMHLSLLEHGVYNQLLDWYYLDEQPLPLENRTLFRRLSARSEIEQQAVLDVLAEMFTQTEQGWVHKRVEREIAQYKAKSQQAREAGKLGGRPPNKGVGSAENRDGFENKPDAKPTANQEPRTTITSPVGEVGKTADAVIAQIGAAAEQQALPDPPSLPDPCPQQQIIDLYHHILPMGRTVREWTPARSQALRARWRESAKRQRLEWWEKFFRYVGESRFLTGQSSSHDRRPFEVSLDWLVKAENMAKVIEGAYHEAAKEAA